MTKLVTVERDSISRKYPETLINKLTVKSDRTSRNGKAPTEYYTLDLLETSSFPLTTGLYSQEWDIMNWKYPGAMIHKLILTGSPQDFSLKTGDAYWLWSTFGHNQLDLFGPFCWSCLELFYSDYSNWLDLTLFFFLNISSKHIVRVVVVNGLNK